MTPIKPVHHELMRTGDQLEAIRMVEILRYVLSEGEAGTSRRDTPSMTLVRIRPQQVTHRTFVRNLDLPVDLTNLLQRVKVRRQASMEAEDFVLNYGGQRQQVEEICVVLPHVCVAVLA